MSQISLKFTNTYRQYKVLGNEQLLFCNLMSLSFTLGLRGFPQKVVVTNHLGWHWSCRITYICNLMMYKVSLIQTTFIIRLDQGWLHQAALSMNMEQDGNSYMNFISKKRKLFLEK